MELIHAIGTLILVNCATFFLLRMLRNLEHHHFVVMHDKFQAAVEGTLVCFNVIIIIIIKSTVPSRIIGCL